MEILPSLAVITLAALVHASFQLSISVLTLLSGHALGAQHSKRRVVSLTASFVGGAAIITVLLLATLALLIGLLFGNQPTQIIWAIVCGFLGGVGLAIWIFYYRRGKQGNNGTSLWVPRGFAHFLTSRAKVTKTNPEAFTLGIASVVGELLFIFAPLLLSAVVLVSLEPLWQMVGILVYAGVSLITLFSVWVLVGSGHSLSSIQRWRETNKHFLQFAAGAGLIILSVFTYVYAVIGELA